MRKFQMTAVAAGLIGGAMLLSGTAPASATTLSGSAFAAPAAMTMIEQVRSHRGDRVRRYDSRRHGSRHRQARSGYRHHRGGYYYASPWWLAAPAIGLSFGLMAPQVTSPVYSGHVQWCHNRFRSYNAATDSYLGYDGLYHRCNSPHRR